MNKLIEYIKSQKSIVISPNYGNKTWSTNLFYGYENNKLYFISPINEKHSEEIIFNSLISFANNRFNPNDFSDRKGIQGLGNCYLAETDADIKKGIELHNLYFPQFKERITFENIKPQENKTHIWYIEIEYIKYWDDELYGNGGTKEFYLTKKED